MNRGSRIVLGLGGLAKDVAYALRTFRRQPGFAAVAVISLAVGIGLNTAVFSIINAIFFQSIRGVPDPGSVVSVGGRSSFVAYRDVRDNSQALSGVAAWQPMSVDMRFRDLRLRRVVPVVSEDYFAVLGVRPVRGRFFDTTTAREPAPLAAAVLDYEFWTETLAGDPSIVGETILINDTPATIVGVAPRTFHGFGPERPPLWIPMGMTAAVRSSPVRWEDSTENGWRIFGRLKDGAGLGEANAELQTLATRSPSLYPGGPLRAATGRERWTGPVSPEKRVEFLLVVVLPLVVVGLILWVGCSNVANLLLARASGRRKEIAIRLANGATRYRIIRLLLTESLLLAVGGGALGLLLAVWTIDFAWATLPEVPRLAVELDAHVLLYTGAVCAVATILFGLVPTLHATRVDVSPVLKGEEPGQRYSVRGTRVRTFFLVTQFASSMALLIVAGTFVRTLVATHVGEQSVLIDHLAVAYVESREKSAPARVQHWNTVREELLHLPLVSSVTVMQSGDNRRARLVPGGSEPASTVAEVGVQRIDRSFFRTAGLVLVAGRDDVADSASGRLERAVVNERTARQFWGTADVVGRRFSLADVGTLEIAGVVRDDGAEARVFRPLTYGAVTAASILVRTSSPSRAAVEPLRATLQRLSGDRAFTRVSTYRDAGIGGLERLTRMAVIVAAVVLSLATVGLYGSISYITSQRTREIAIRMALGARRPAVLRLLAREGMLVVAGGSVLGLALTAFAFQFMSGMIFARWTLEPITVAGVLTAFSLATVGACYLPGRRAVRIDPMSVLRSD